MIKNRKSNLFLFTLILVLLLPSISMANQGIQMVSDGLNLENSIWVWAEKSGDQHAIFLSRQNTTGWEEPVQISDNEAVNVTPAITKTTENELFVVWSAFSNQRAQLYYKQFKNGIWRDEKEYYSGLTSNTAPNIAVDADGKLWIVWAGFNGISDEIYYTTWNGNTFETGIAITANDIPDILPVLGINKDTGNPWVQWQQYSETGYVLYESTWNGSEWGSAYPVPSLGEETKTVRETQAVAHTRLIKRRIMKSGGTLNTSLPAVDEKPPELEVPSFISDPESASIHMTGYGIQSLPVRNMISAE